MGQLPPPRRDNGDWWPGEGDDSTEAMWLMFFAAPLAIAAILYFVTR